MIFLVAKRELKSFFKSPLAYLVSGFFTLIMGWIFFNLLLEYVETVQNIPRDDNGQWSFVSGVVFKLFGNINFMFLFISPIITMKLFAEEKKESTIDLYYASPIKEYQIVLGKYLASVIMGLFLITTTFLFPFVFNSTNFEGISFIISGYIGLILNMMCYFAVGLFASSLTNNQIIAALISFIFIISTWMFNWFGQLSSNYLIMEILNYLSLVGHYETFSKGLISTSDFMYYFSFIAIFLFLTKKVIEARNW